ncbi:hypothetical protein [Nocardia arizonensis]|uniref:hypothetical protein n=1 Tax=Nocardia arizonensis TaxID=1141647 RepID=UPI0006D27EB0|nr:hypothetical protein [Nocardia arizonensis]
MDTPWGSCPPTLGRSDRDSHRARLGWAGSLAGGYFVGPTSRDKKGIYGPEFLPTMALLVRVHDTGVIPPIGQDERAEAIADLNSWRADVLVLPGTSNADALRSVVTQLVGFAPTRVQDVWVWNVRQLR